MIPSFWTRCLRAFAAVPIVAAAAVVRPLAASAQSTLAAAPDSTIDAGILREVERANARGLPAEPLLAKVREGRLKRAGASRIRIAVAALAGRLDSARAALGPRATSDELSAGADALAAGATPTALRALRDAAAPRPIGPSLGVLAQLVASGLPTSRALAMITELLRRNVAAAQVIAFGNAVEADAAGGVPPDESATFRLHTLGESAATTAATFAAPPSVGNVGGATIPTKSAPTTPKRRP